MLSSVRSVYPFQNIAYTLHKSGSPRLRALHVAKDNGIKLIVCKFIDFDRALPRPYVS